jgi:hypothetical protein
MSILLILLLVMEFMPKNCFNFYAADAYPPWVVYVSSLGCEFEPVSSPSPPASQPPTPHHLEEVSWGEWGVPSPPPPSRRGQLGVSGEEVSFIATLLPSALSVLGKYTIVIIYSLVWKLEWRLSTSIVQPYEARVII